jgi:hypothetical protein
MGSYLCEQCDRQEEACHCDRYCCLCQGWDNVRLGSDGRYYCLNCREACDMVAQS